MSKKTRYVCLSESDLPAGTALPWSIFLRSGELLAPAGFVVQDSVMSLRLMMATPMRAATEADDPAKTVEAEPDPGLEKIVARSLDRGTGVGGLLLTVVLCHQPRLALYSSSPP